MSDVNNRTSGETSADHEMQHELLAQIADDFASRYRHGEHPSLDEYVSKYPALASEIRDMFPALVVMEQPGRDMPPGLLSHGERPGAVIGRYKLLERIGEGGFGVVFMAEQQHPVRRKVALKLLKPGMDTKQVIARFEAERQALALMDHPNIARVLDAGATDSGRPYFVMELVHGVPMTNYCDRNKLTPRERLELFIQVCRAVQHAHTKGIIHRDLKPTNVLVTLHDGVAVPKVIDFGIAKAMGQQLTERTLFTNFAQMVGTPLYMSPEQAEMSGLDVDTRSDIYSLGVLLYELLTGTTPFDPDRLKQAAYDEVRRIIRDEEPPRPSTRLSTMGDKLATVSAHCKTDPRRLGQIVRGELDWIVMKALEKDRNRRYETANSLATDVQHYLRDEPVHACPPSKWYSFRKFVARNKRVVSTATVLALSVLVAAVTLAVTNVMIRQEQARTKDQKDRAEVAQKLAEKRADEIRQGLERLKAANALLDRGRWCATRRQWDDAHAAFTKAIEIRPDHASVWMERADLHTLLGLWDLAATDYAREIELREPDTTLRWFQHALLSLHVGDTDAYYVACRKMRQRFHGTLDRIFAEEFVRSSLLAPDPNVDLPLLVQQAQKFAVHQPWSGLYVLGVAHYRSGQYDLAIQRLQEALAAQPRQSTRLLSQPVLAMAYHRLGRTAEAHQALGEAALVLDQWTRRRYEGSGAVWPVPWWDYLECQLTYREARLLIEGSLPPEDARLHVLRARALAALGWAESKAAPEYQAALQLSPHDPQIRLEAHRNQGYCFVHNSQWEKAADEFAKACALKPDDSYLWRFRAVASFASGNRAAYRQVCTEIVQRFEKTEDRVTAGNVLLSCLLRDDALPDMARLLPLSRLAEPLFHWGAWVRGGALYRAGRYEESVQCFEAAAGMYRPRAWDWCFLAMAHHRLGHYEDARRCLAEAARWIEEANRQEMDDMTGTRPSWGGWHERVAYPILLREAEGLLK